MRSAAQPEGEFIIAARRGPMPGHTTSLFRPTRLQQLPVAVVQRQPFLSPVLKLDQYIPNTWCTDNTPTHGTEIDVIRYSSWRPESDGHWRRIFNRVLFIPKHCRQHMLTNIYASNKLLSLTHIQSEWRESYEGVLRTDGNEDKASFDSEA